MLVQNMTQVKPRSPAITQRLLEHDLTRLNGLTIQCSFFQSRSSLSSGVSCDGTCCNTDMTSLSSRATSPTWTTSDTIPASTTRSRFASLTSPTSSYKSYRTPYNSNSSSNLVQLDRSPQRRGPQGRGWVEFGGQSLTSSHKQNSRAKYRSLRV